MGVLSLIILVFAILPSAYQYYYFHKSPTNVDMSLMFVATTLFAIERFIYLFK